MRHVDSEIGTLRAHLTKLHLPIDLVVVSDHGMAAEQGGWIDLDQYADFSGVQTAGALMYPDSEATAAKLYTKLRIPSDKFKVYRRNRMPAELDYTGEPRIGDPVVVATGLIRSGYMDRPILQGTILQIKACMVTIRASCPRCARSSMRKGQTFVRAWC